MEATIINLTHICVEILKHGGSLDDLPKEKVPRLADVLNEALGQNHRPVEKRRPILVIAELSGINNATIHKILHGDLNPTRNTILRLAITLEMSYETTQVFLKSGNRSLLSGGRDRDKIIMKGIIQKRNLGDVCQELSDNGFEDLFSKRE